jgi:HD-GYP domain-containing protein (c-di-GMP phosphodiesterase class II)
LVEFRKTVKKEGVEERRPGAEAPEFAFSARSGLKHAVIDRTAQEIYLEGLVLSAAVAEWAASDARADFPLHEPLNALVGDVTNRLATDQAWALLSHCRASSEPRFLPAHSMNTCILASFIGMNMNLRDDQIAAVANIAFLHDIGLTRLSRNSDLCLHQTFNEYGLITKAAPAWDCCPKPNPDYLESIQRHPLDSLKLIDATGRIDDPGIALAAVNHHERIDGSGYPNRKTATDLSLASNILAVADTYLGITHRAAGGRGVEPFDAVRIISQLAGRKLSSEVTRSFLQSMSIYPIGSGVRLNNGIIARVIGANEKQLTKPVVMVISAVGDTFSVDQIIDLSREKLLFVREPVCLGPLDPVFNIG